MKRNSSSANIELILNRKADEKIGDEGYTLNVTQQKISIRANKPAGLLYGVQTFFSAVTTTDREQQKRRKCYMAGPFC